MPPARHRRKYLLVFDLFRLALPMAILELRISPDLPSCLSPCNGRISVNIVFPVFNFWGGLSSSGGSFGKGFSLALSRATIVSATVTTVTAASSEKLRTKKHGYFVKAWFQSHAFLYYSCFSTRLNFSHSINHHHRRSKQAQWARRKEK